MPDNSLNNKRIAKNTLFLYIRMIFVLLVSIYTTRVVLNVLGVIDYGINNVVCGFVSMFSFLNTSMANGIQRFYNFEKGAGHEDSLIKVYNTALLIQIILAFLLIVLLETIGLWYLNNKMVIPSDRVTAARWIYQFSVISLTIVVLQTPFSAAIMAYEKMDYYAIVSIIDVLLKLGIALVLPYVQYDKLISYGALLLLISITNFLLYYVYCKVHFRQLKLRISYRMRQFVEMLSFSGWNIFDAFAYTLKGQGLNVLLNNFFGPVVNAARGISGTINGAIQGFATNIVISFRPQLIESYAQGNHKRVKQLMYSLSKLSYVMLFTLTVPVAIEVEYILSIWLKGTVPDYTVVFTLLVLAIMVINSLNTPLSQTVQAVGKLKTYQIVRSILITATLPVAWVVLKLGGNPISVYWVSLVLTIINQPLSMVLLKRIFPYSYMDYIKQVIIPCAVYTLLLPVVPYLLFLIMEQSFIRLLIICITTCIVGIVLLYLFVMNKEEKNLIINYLKIHK